MGAHCLVRREATVPQLIAMSSSIPDENKRPIRSYVIRSGRLTDSQRKAIESYWGKYVVEFNREALDLDTLFKKPQRLTVEIGFGMGDSLLEMARQSPDQNFLGIEVHQPGVGKLLNGIADNQLTNIKLICHDAREILETGLPDNCIDRLLLLFPDPWHKKRHNKRRLVQPEFIELLLEKLSSLAELHFATDWQAYAEYMMEVLEADPRLENILGAQNYWMEPERPVTKFEKRGQRLGHGVWDLRFRVRV